MNLKTFILFYILIILSELSQGCWNLYFNIVCYMHDNDDALLNSDDGTNSVKLVFFFILNFETYML